MYMTASTSVFAVHMIASGAIRIGLLLLAIWALIRLVDRLRTPLVVNAPATPVAPIEQSVAPSTSEV
jgi:hypothetical protein